MSRKLQNNQTDVLKFVHITDTHLLNQSEETFHRLNTYSPNALLICGHVHQEVDRQIGELRLLATPSTCHQFKANSDDMHRVKTPSPAYRYIKISAVNGIDNQVHYAV
jgi:Icc protein